MASGVFASEYHTRNSTCSMTEGCNLPVVDERDIVVVRSCATILTPRRDTEKRGSAEPCSVVRTESTVGCVAGYLSIS